MVVADLLTAENDLADVLFLLAIIAAGLACAVTATRRTVDARPVGTALGWLSVALVAFGLLAL